MVVKLFSRMSLMVKNEINMADLSEFTSMILSCGSMTGHVLNVSSCMLPITSFEKNLILTERLYLGQNAFFKKSSPCAILPRTWAICDHNHLRKGKAISLYYVAGQMVDQAGELNHNPTLPKIAHTTQPTFYLLVFHIPS